MTVTVWLSTKTGSMWTTIRWLAVKVGSATVADTRPGSPSTGGDAPTRCSNLSTPSAQTRMFQSALKMPPQRLHWAHHSTVIGPPTVCGPAGMPVSGVVGQPSPGARHQLQLVS